MEMLTRFVEVPLAMRDLIYTDGSDCLPCVIKFQEPDSEGRVGMLVAKIEYGVAYGHYLYPSIGKDNELDAIDELDEECGKALEYWNKSQRPAEKKEPEIMVEFGKYAGMTVKELLAKDRRYAQWAYENIERFRHLIDDNDIVI